MSLRVFFSPLVLLAVSFTATTATLQADEPKSDKEKFTGTWREVSKTMAGETTVTGQNGWGLFTYRAQDGKLSEWSITEDTTKAPDRIYTLIINAAATPKQMDWIHEIDGERFVFPAIYEWNGDKLKVSLATDAVDLLNDGRAAVEKRRPKNFRPTAKTVKRQNQLIILEKLQEK